MNKKIKSLLSDTIIFAVGSIGTRFIMFFLVPLYTNFLTAAEYGTAELVFTAAQLLQPVLSLVIFDAVIRFCFQKGVHRENVILCSLLVAMASALVTAAVTPLVGLYKPLGPWKWQFCFYLMLNTLNSVQRCCLKAKGMNKRYVIISLAETLFYAMLCVLLLTILDQGVRGYLNASIYTSAVCAVALFLSGRLWEDLKNSWFDGQLLKQMLAFSTPLILNNISWWVIQSSDKVMLEWMMDESAIGIYTVATKIPALINVIISIFSQAWGLSVYKEYEGQNDTSFYSRVFKAYTALVFGACVAIVTVVRPFMAVYVGDDFFEAWQYVPLLLVSAVFSAISSYFGTMYGALKRSMANSITTLIAAVANIAVNYLLIPICGIWGAVIGTAVSYIVIAIVRMMDILRFIRLKVDWLHFASCSILIVVQALAVCLQWCAWAVSPVVIVLFVLLNRDILKLALGKVKQEVKKLGKKTAG